MTAFDAAFNRLMGLEGGYSDSATDRGGKTNGGITEAVARENGFLGDMRTLPESLKREIYRKKYWDELRLEEIYQLAPSVADELFDTGVNLGTGRAAMFLQRTLNVLNRRQHDYNDIKVDGAIGPKTISCLKTLLLLRGGDGQTVLLRALNALQGVFYIELAERDPTQEDFAFGWLVQRVA